MNKEQLNNIRHYSIQRTRKLQETKEKRQEKSKASAIRQEERYALFHELGQRNEDNKGRSKRIASLRPTLPNAEDTLVVIENGIPDIRSALIARVLFNSNKDIGKISFWEIMPTYFGDRAFSEDDVVNLHLEDLREMRDDGHATKLAEERTYVETFRPSGSRGDYIVPSETIHGRSFNPIDSIIRSRSLKKAEERIEDFSASLKLIDGCIRTRGINTNLVELSEQLSRTV